MSKESFSKKISETMHKKMQAIGQLDSKNSFDEFNNAKILFENDEYFEIAICLAYMSLSKEKIIEKEIKNTDRLGRLTQKVDMGEINKVFQPGFAAQMPKIIMAKENNNLWILDNIRDSIMHGACDIDEQRKCFLINNNQYDRELVAEVPFSWFIAYAKNDILSKKLADRYTVKGFYYNKLKKDHKYLETNKELNNNILYRVNIIGNKFNVKDIEKRVKELFLLYSDEEISDELVSKYENQINNEKFKYNKKYLVSFYLAKDKVINEIKKEFPDVDLKVFIDNRKYRFVNRETKRMEKYFNNYDLMFNIFNNALLPKGISLLRCMSNIIENIDNDIGEETLDRNHQIEKIHKLLTGEGFINGKSKNLSVVQNQDLKILQSIYLNIYGLSTLVINHETLYNPHFLNKEPSELGLLARQKRIYLEYANRQKSLIMQDLDIRIMLFSKYEQLGKCKDDAAKKKIQSIIDSMILNLQTVHNELENLATTVGYEQMIRQSEVDFNEQQLMYGRINEYFYHFESAKDVEVKKKIKKIIGSLIDTKTEVESKYTYGYCYNMQDALTIIRNSFSHIGRIYVGKINGPNTTIILNDYDTNGEKSADVVCLYKDLIQLLENPYLSIEQNKNHSK